MNYVTIFIKDLEVLGFQIDYIAESTILRWFGFLRIHRTDIQKCSINLI